MIVINSTIFHQDNLKLSPNADLDSWMSGRVGWLGGRMIADFLSVEDTWHPQEVLEGFKYILRKDWELGYRERL